MHKLNELILLKNANDIYFFLQLVWLVETDC